MSNEPEIVELLGLEKTLQLEQVLGGQRKYIAANPSERSPIVRVIGMDAARRLATRFGGMLLYIPQHLASRVRNQEILLAVWAGEHKQAIGHRYGLVERTIRKIVQGECNAQFGQSCRQLRAQVQGYKREQCDDRERQRPATQPGGKGHRDSSAPGG
ncbi:MAG: Mor transcription activator family protein [Endozoicomonas sp.]